MENMGFVNDVTSLLLQLGYLNELPKEDTPNTGGPPCSLDSFNYISNSVEPSMIDNQTSFFFTLSQTGPHHQTKIGQPMKFNFSSSNQSTNVVAKAEVIPSKNPEMFSSRKLPSNIDIGSVRCKEPKMLFDTENSSSALLMTAQRTNPLPMHYSDKGNINSENPSSSDLKNVISKSEANTVKKLVKNEMSVVKRQIDRNVVPLPQYNELENVSSDEKPNSRDDLFDVLGSDFKKKLFNSFWNDESSSNFPSIADSRGNSESGIFSSTSSDHLLETVVSKIQYPAKRGLHDSVSCATTFTNLSTSSKSNSCSLPYGRFGISDCMKREMLGLPKFTQAGSTDSGSFRVWPTKEKSGAYSNGSSFYGSQLSSWIEKDQKGKKANNCVSVSTGYSKKADEASGKTDRKRLKPGENPRPRPKDRQMIQDRVKELRKIVPNGAKCSIDSLLECTIKHMLFLQSVTKHADKLKQTGKSKIISKNGGLLLKDEFEGGATWAYEVGSQTMVCPIIVEDLNQPRQMLVEMLCEERGLFLEIADIIRGLGLMILKGIMETRKDKIWARFAVEANRDITRMEIFISLVRLLEQTMDNGGPQRTAQFH